MLGHQIPALTRSLQNQTDRQTARPPVQGSDSDSDIDQPCEANQAFTGCLGSTQSSRHSLADLDETSPSGNPSRPGNDLAMH